MWSRRAKSLVGLDIGSHAMKLVHLASDGRRFQLLKLGMFPIPPHAIVDGAITDTAAIQGALRRLVAMEKLADKDIALALSGHSVIVKKVRMVRMSAEELANAIPYEAEQHIPFDVYDVNIDFQILDSQDAGNGKGGQMDVLLVAAKKGRVQELARVAQAAQLRPAVVDVDMLALINCFEQNYPEEVSGRVLSLVHIGASLMTVLVLKDGLSTFQRDITFGGNHYTAAVQKAFALSREDAEAVKLGVKEAQGSRAEVLAVLHRVTDDAVTEIKRSFEFYVASAADEPIEKVYLSGGCARMKGLAQLLNSRLGLSVEVLDPFRYIGAPERLFDAGYVREMGPMAAVAVGLAMRRKGA